MRLRTSRSFFFIVLAAWGGLLPAQATEGPLQAEEKSIDALIELLNTQVELASRRWQKSMESPQAIEVLSGEQIRTSGAWRLMDLLQLMTNVQVYDMDGQVSRIAMRGVAPNSTPKTIQVLVDGVALYNSEVFPTDIEGIPVPLDAIERVELVRGPSSSLYGANAQLGVIAITTRKAKFPLEGSLRGGAANNGGFRRQATFLVNTGSFRMTAGFGGLSNRKLDEPQKGVGFPLTHLPDNQYHQQQVFVRPEVKWKDTTLWAAFGQSDKRTGPETAFVRVDPILLIYLPLYGLGTHRYRVELGQAGWTQAWTPSLKSTLRVNHTEILNGMGGGLYAIPGIPQSPATVEIVRANVPGFETMENLTDFTSHELALQLNWDASKDLHFVFGGDTRKMMTPGSPVQGIPRKEPTASGAFVSVDWDPGFATFSGGARAENETLGGSRISPRLAVVVPIGSASVLRAGWYTSTRSPQMTEIYNDLHSEFVANSTPNPALKPEAAENLELGYRRTFSTWSLDLTLYRMKLKRTITSVAIGRRNGQNLTQFQNSGTDRTNQGLELSMQGKIRSGWQAGFNGAYVDYPDSLLGRQAHFSPRTSANLWARVRFGGFFGYMALQHLGAYTRYTSFANASEEERARFQAHFNLGFESFRGFSASVYGINAAQPVTYTGAAGLQNQFLSRYARREVGLQASYRF